jgi:uncharacterized protein YcfJ
MKQSVLFAALGLVALGASAQEVGNVISSVPVVQQVAVPRQVCNNQPMAVQAPNSGGGALLGAIIGGVVGNQIGHGIGRAAATGFGAVIGGGIGNNAETNGQRYQNVAQCGTETTYENRTVGYNVTYEYGGRQHTVQMPYDPGQTIRLQVTPYSSNEVPANGAVVTAPPVGVQAAVGQPVYAQQAPVYVTSQPAPVVYSGYPAYAYPYPTYRPYYYPPVGVSLNFGFGGGHRHWR